jgi:hypothetical protein
MRLFPFLALTSGFLIGHGGLDLTPDLLVLFVSVGLIYATTVAIVALMPAAGETRRAIIKTPHA